MPSHKLTNSIWRYPIHRIGKPRENKGEIEQLKAKTNENKSEIEQLKQEINKKKRHIIYIPIYGTRKLLSEPFFQIMDKDHFECFRNGQLVILSISKDIIIKVNGKLIDINKKELLSIKRGDKLFFLPFTFKETSMYAELLLAFNE